MALIAVSSEQVVRAEIVPDTLASMAPPEAIFGSRELQIQKLTAFPQWTSVLEKMLKQREALARCLADETNCVSPVIRSWRRVVTTAAGLDREKRLEVINRFFNRWPFREDREAYGTREYWATPSEFMNNSGDCEDYVIAKFFALRHLGFSNEEMRIAVVYDRKRRIGHVVLAIFSAHDIVILNNQTDLIVSHSRYENYVPLYLLNETEIWNTPDASRRRFASPHNDRQHAG